MRNTDQRTVPLTVVKAGIDRLRTKGGARADSLYELQNGVVTDRATVKARPGTIRKKTLPAGTVGLVAFDSCLHVFASEYIDIAQSITVTIGESGGRYGWNSLVPYGSVDPASPTIEGQNIEAIYWDTAFFFIVVDVASPDALVNDVRVETGVAGVYITLAAEDATIGEGYHRWSTAAIDWDDAIAGDRTINSVDSPCIELDILLHPADPAAAVSEIHFAAPFLGALYVVAEFDSGEIFDYWLQNADAWEAAEEYSVNELVVPNTSNGLAYRATRAGTGYPAWRPGVARTAGNGSSIDPDVIEPTVYNEYYYTATDTGGDNPRSGSAEPTWPTNNGEAIIENTDGFEAVTPEAVAPPTPPSNNTPQSSTTERYG